MMTKQTKFILAISLQVIIIFATVIFNLSVTANGTEIMLRINPVDPRDMLRGDYANFEYDISYLNPFYAFEEQIKNGDTIYVVLWKSGKYWSAGRIQKSKPMEGELFIKGKVESGGTESKANQSSYPGYDTPMLHIVYGIEEYFIPEGKGQNFSFWDKESAAMVVIDNNGNASLKSIYVDGNPWP